MGIEPKHGTACKTCRRRGRKCDKTLPSCKTCQAKGLVCDGYAFRWPGMAARGKYAGQLNPETSTLQALGSDHLSSIERPVALDVQPFIDYCEFQALRLQLMEHATETIHRYSRDNIGILPWLLAGRESICAICTSTHTRDSTASICRSCFCSMSLGCSDSGRGAGEAESAVKTRSYKGFATEAQI